ncbi:MAG: sugar phosphate isomerase/epimerase family protein [Bacteroidota bacterium]
MKRRHFTQYAATASLTPFLPFNLSTRTKPISDPLEIHVFSKHLQFLDYKELGKMVKEMGFDGADLTVRPGGHVLPENVNTDLPKAVEGLRLAGLQPKLMTTAITDGNDPINQNLLKTAAENGLKFYRLGWFRYPETGSIIEAVEEFNKKIIEITRLNKKFGINGSYQNHSGAHYAGASLWELNNILGNTSLPYQGCQFDVRHAVVEGGLSWPTAFRLIQPRINTIVLKDFKWVQEGDQWKVLDTPIGEGMVDFDAYFKLLKANNINVPVSMHFEYDLGGANHGHRKISIPKEQVYEAMIRDLNVARNLWEKA